MISTKPTRKLSWTDGRTLSVAEKLRKLSQVDPVTGCHIWHGCRWGSGYGRMCVNYQTASTHRLAWELANGRPVPPGLCVLHRCDNPPCCNPEHLFVGTMADNLSDMRHKNRGRSSITPESVRQLRASSLNNSQAARFFGMHRRTVQRIRNGTAFKHVT